MDFVYAKAESLWKLPRVGTGQCVALVKEYAKAPVTTAWKEGDPVRGNALIRTGTAIATFVNGKYPNHSSGNHAALYLRQDEVGIWVIDQFSSKATIQKRCIAFKGKNKAGHYIDSSNNGDAFAVIERL